MTIPMDVNDSNDVALGQAYLRALDPGHLHLILFVTEQCNFRCEYCYEDFELGQMSAPVVLGIKNLIGARIHELSSIEISWFGGEPLLAKRVIFEISEHVQRLLDNHPAVVFQANITTNAFFLDETTFLDLVRAGVTMFHISLDGLGEVHDSTRRQAGGGGTFQRIWQNLLSIRETDAAANVLLRVHYSPDKLEKIDDLVAAINENFAYDQRFKVYFHAIEKLGAQSDVQRRTFSVSQEHEIGAALNSKLKYPSMKWDNHSATAICYASSANSLAIRADGAVAKCTVALRESANNLGLLKPDGTLELDIQKYRKWLHGLTDLEPLALACPLQTLKRDGMLDAQSSSLITIAQAM